ncbi:MAG: hypothetical protein JW928_02125 [Candidatus Aureabacteria bacterium]|nr:hypothetical protein [Candidatus Auribacterota bacterium]
MKNILLSVLVCLLSSRVAFSGDARIERPDNFWIAYAAEKGAQTQIFIQQFKDGEWQEPVQGTDSASYNNAPTIAVGPDQSVWVAWSGFDNISTSIYAKKYNDGKWSDECRVSIPDAFEDSQPSLDIRPEGTPVIVWAGHDGMDDEILISSFTDGNWSNEEQVNIPNQTPDIDPCVCALQEGVLIVWSGYQNEQYQIMSAKSKNSSFSGFMEVDIKLPASWKKGEFPSLVSNRGLALFYFSRGDVYRSLLNRNTYAVEKFPEKAFLTEDMEKALRKLDLNNIQNIAMAFSTSEKISHTINLSLFLEKIKSSSLLNHISSSFHQGKAYLWNMFFTEAEALAVTLNKNTAFGDSITYGYKSTTGGYPARLSAKLGQTVVNRGVGGETTAAGLSRINSVLRQDDPQRIFIMEGTNDMNQGRSISSVIFNLKEMVIRSQNYGSTPYLATICPNDRKQQTTQQLNAEIRSLAVQLGVSNPDVYSAFGGAVTSTYFIDYIHPNDAGYDIIANTFYNSIFPQSSSSSGGSGGCGSIRTLHGDSGAGFNFFFVFLLFVFYLLRKASPQIQRN